MISLLDLPEKGRTKKADMWLPAPKDNADDGATHLARAANLEASKIPPLRKKNKLHEFQESRPFSSMNRSCTSGPVRNPATPGTPSQGTLSQYKRRQAAAVKAKFKSLSLKSAKSRRSSA